MKKTQSQSDPAARTLLSAVAPIPEAERQTVLVVDDEPLIRRFAAEFLERIGYRVLLAENGVCALRALSEAGGNVDLILMDIVMPEMDGREAFYAVRKRYPDLKIILTSGYTDSTVSQELLAAGALDFLAKPFDALDMVIAVQSALEPGIDCD